MTRSGPFSTFLPEIFCETSCNAPSQGLPFRSVGIETKWTFRVGSSRISFTSLVACMRPFLTRGSVENPSHCPRPGKEILPALMLRAVSGTMSYPTHLIPFLAKYAIVENPMYPVPQTAILALWLRSLVWRSKLPASNHCRVRSLVGRFPKSRQDVSDILFFDSEPLRHLFRLHF